MQQLDLSATEDGFLRSGMVRFHESLGPLMEHIDSISPAPYNYNSGDVEVIEHSIEMNGMYRPVYVQSATGDIIAGNHTWMACKKLGSGVVPVVRLDVDDTTAKRIMIEDNEAARKAVPDHGLLLTLLDEIHAETGEYLSSITERDVEVLRALNEIPLESDEFGQWPTLTFQVPPGARRAFYRMTEGADTDSDRFQLLLRLAGWDGGNE